MSLTLPQIRALLYQHKDFGWRNLGFVSTAVSRSATTWFDSVMFGASNLGEFQFADGWIRGQGMSSLERVKMAGALVGSGSAGLYHADDNNYAAPFTVNLTYEWTVPGVHPDALDRLCRDALREIYTPFTEAVTPWYNGNFNDGTTGWIAGATAPLSIASTESASYNQSGQKSLRVTNNVAGGYATSQYPLRDIAAGQVFRLSAIFNAIVGTGRFELWDVTHGTQIGTSMLTTGYARTRVSQDFTVPVGCTEINCRLVGPESNADVVWDFIPGHRTGARFLEAGSWLDEGFKLPLMATATYSEAIQGNLYAFAADSRALETWNKVNYHTENLPVAGTPNRVIVDDPDALNEVQELWYVGRRQWSDFDALLDDTATTDAPRELVEAACIVKLCDLLFANTGDGNWKAVQAREQRVLDAQEAIRLPVARTKPKREFIGGRLGTRRGFGALRGF